MTSGRKIGIAEKRIIAGSFGKTSTRKIAERLGVTRATIHYHARKMELERLTETEEVYRTAKARIERIGCPIHKKFLQLIPLSQRGQHELARRTGYAIPSAMIRWRRGRSPKLSAVIDILEALGYEIQIVKKEAADAVPAGSGNQDSDSA